MNLRDYREKHRGCRWTIASLPLNDEQKEIVMEYLAARYWAILEVLEPDSSSWGWKEYDPLTIEGRVALSYVFDFEDGGRRHPFRDLTHLEDMLLKEIVKEIRLTFGDERQEEESEVEGTAVTPIVESERLLD